MKPSQKNITVRDLIIEYFKKYPKQDLKHGPVVDYVEKKYLKKMNKKPRDVWREIRRLYQEGFLIKLKMVVNRYDPDFINDSELQHFSDHIKKKIFERDNYKCVVCGRGLEDGIEIHVDHKVPLSRGGDNSIENGQTLCSEHNLLKKNYSQTEFGKRLVIDLYEKALKIGDNRIIKFCKSIFDVYNSF